MKPDIDTELRRLSYIPLHHQINWLRSEIAKHPHSHRSKLLQPVLEKRVLKALRQKPRAA